MDYIIKFQQLNFKTQWNNKTLLTIFQNKLKDHLKDNLIKLETPSIKINKIIWIII